MADLVQGLEEHHDETRWCVQCDTGLKWPYHDECLGCLTVGGRPADTWSFRTVHWDTAVLHAVIRRKVAVWEQRHPGWELVPDMQRYWEDSTHPSKYVDRETTIGRKLAWTRFRVERRHPRGVRTVRLTGEALWRVVLGGQGHWAPATQVVVSARELEEQFQGLRAAALAWVLRRDLPEVRHE